MIVFPNCKINLGLSVLQKRSDGFHALETVFYPIAITDALEIIEAPSSTNEIEFTASGLPVDGNSSDNSCLKAYQLLKKDYPDLPPIEMHLHKAIPMGAGLGGGSADAAFTLMALNKKFQLSITEEQLSAYALALGSDCPFFIKNGPCYATGRGEVLKETSINLSGYQLVIVHPGIHINTGWAFSQLKLSSFKPAIKEIIKQPVESWKDTLENDFEAAVFLHHPEVKQCKEALYGQGAIYACMTGSGSTVYGIFPKNVSITYPFPPHYFVKKIPAV